MNLGFNSLFGLIFLNFVLEKIAFSIFTVVMSTERSPKFPAISLQEGLSTIEKLFKNAGRTALEPLGLVKAIGYGGLNGASRSMLGALSGYGLLAKEGGGKYRVSDDALHAVKPLNEEERLQYIRKLALHPPLFSELFRTSKECSESVLATTLLHQNFTEEGARRAAKIFKENFEFAKLGEEGIGFENEAGNGEKVENGSPAKKAYPTPPAQPSHSISLNPVLQALSNINELSIPVGDNRMAKIPFPISEEDFDLFVSTLTLWKKKLVIKPMTFPIAAMWKNKDFDKPVTITGFMGETNGTKYYRSEDGTGIPQNELIFG